MKSPTSPESDAADQGWVQTRLFPPSTFEAHLRVGYVAESEHVQWQVEVFEPGTKELLAMASVHHRHAVSPLQAAELALLGLERLLGEVFNPDPF